MSPSLADVSQDYLYCMFKGEPGTRKSTQAMSFPKPQYWFSIDQKMDALILPSRAWKVDPAKDIKFDDYSNLSNNPATKGYDGVRKKLEQLQVNCPFKTIVVDSITQSNSVSINTGFRNCLGPAGARAVRIMPD